MSKYSCECYKEIENDIKDIIVKNKGIDEDVVKSTNYEGLTYLWSGGIRTSSTIVVEYEHTTKKGKKMRKKVKEVMLHSYCPHCGKKYEYYPEEEDK